MATEMHFLEIEETGYDFRRDEIAMNELLDKTWSDPYERLVTTSTFSRGCMKMYENDPLFFQKLLLTSPENDLLDWVKIIRTFSRYCGGNVNQETYCSSELIVQLNNAGSKLTRKVFRELERCYFTFDGKDDDQIKSYGKIGLFGSIDGNDDKIGIMGQLCQHYGWFDKVDDRTLEISVFGVQCKDPKLLYHNVAYKIHVDLVKMYTQYDKDGRLGKIWDGIPEYVRDYIDPEVVEFMNGRRSSN